MAIAPIVKLIGVALLIVTVITLQIVACLITGDWVLLTSLLAYLLPPIPIILLGLNSGNSKRDRWAQFLTSFFVVSIFAIPIVYFTSGLIKDASLALYLVSTLLAVATCALAFWWRQNDEWENVYSSM